MSVLNQIFAIANAETVNSTISWYVPHYRLNAEQQAIIQWTFQLGSQLRFNVPIWIVLGIQQRTRLESQELINDTFHRPPVTSAHCIIGGEKF